MRFSTWMWLCLSVWMPVSAVASAPEPQLGEPVTIGHRYKIESKVLKETRRYLVHKPVGYDFSNQRYPVVILLDGESNFHHVSASLDELVKAGRIPPLL